MKIKPMQNVPSSRAELERHLFLLGETLREQKIHFGHHLIHSIEGLRRLRKLPNGRVDFLSLDEMTRLIANMLVNMPQGRPPNSEPGHDSIDEGEHFDGGDA